MEFWTGESPRSNPSTSFSIPAWSEWEAIGDSDERKFGVGPFIYYIHPMYARVQPKGKRAPRVMEYSLLVRGDSAGNYGMSTGGNIVTVRSDGTVERETGARHVSPQAAVAAARRHFVMRTRGTDKSPRSNPTPSYDHQKLVQAVFNFYKKFGDGKLIGGKHVVIDAMNGYKRLVLEDMSYEQLHALAVRVKIRSNPATKTKAKPKARAKRGTKAKFKKMSRAQALTVNRAIARAKAMTPAQRKRAGIKLTDLGPRAKAKRKPTASPPRVPKSKASAAVLKEVERTLRTRFKGMHVVFTGELMNMTRARASRVVREGGGTVGSSITKRTTTVVVGDKPGSKLAKARKLGLDTMTGAQFQNLQLLGRRDR